MGQELTSERARAMAKAKEEVARRRSVRRARTEVNISLHHLDAAIEHADEAGLVRQAARLATCRRQLEEALQRLPAGQQ